MAILKRATQTLRDAGHSTLQVHRGLWGYSVNDTRYPRQSWPHVRKTAAEAVEDVLLRGVLPEQIEAAP